MTKPKLFFVDGIRHSAVVIADNADEAIATAGKSAAEVNTTPKLLYGYVGSWEVPEAHELKLPEGYQLIVYESKTKESRTQSNSSKYRKRNHRTGGGTLPDPITLAQSSKKWTRTSARELEKLSEE